MKRQTEHHTLKSLPSRRQFLTRSAKFVAGSVLTAVTLSRAYAAEDNTIRLALVGCGGRGSGAVGDALSSSTGPTKLVAMADVFEDRLTGSYKALSEQFGAAHRCAGGAAIRRLRCLSQGHRLPASGRRYDPGHPFGFPATPPGVCHREGRQCLYGEVVCADPGGTKRILRLGRGGGRKRTSR